MPTPAQGPVQEAELDALSLVEQRITVQNCLLIIQDIVADATDRLEIGRIGRVKGLPELFRRHADLAGREVARSIRRE